MSVLQGLLQDLSAELQHERTEFKCVSKAAQSKAAEVRMVFTLQASAHPPLCVRKSC